MDKEQTTRLYWLLALNTSLLVAQVVFTILTNYLIILSDAADSFVDSVMLIALIVTQNKQVGTVVTHSIAIGMRATVLFICFRDVTSHTIDNNLLAVIICGVSIITNVLLICIGIDKDDGDSVYFNRALLLDFLFDVIQSTLGLMVAIIRLNGDTIGNWIDVIGAIVLNCIFLSVHAYELKKSFVKLSGNTVNAVKKNSDNGNGQEEQKHIAPLSVA